MQKTQLIQSLRSIKEDELHQLSYFAAMHLPERDTAAGRLFAYWHHWKKSGKEEAPALNKEVVQKAIFEQNVSPTRLRQAAAELYKIVQDFLVWKELEQQTSTKWHLRLNVLQGRNLQKLAKDAFKKTSKQRQKTPLGIEGYHTDHLLAIHEYELAMVENNHQQRVSLIPALQELDYYYLVQKLRFACFLGNSNRVLGTQTVAMEEVETMLEKLNIEEQPVLLIYHRLYKLLYPKLDAVDEFPILLDLLETAQLHLPPDELRNVFQLAINRCIKELKQGNVVRQKIQFDLYMEMDKKNLLLENGKIASENYKSIVRIACRLSKYDWATGFSEKYKKYLPKKDAKNYFHFNMAAIAFYQKNYDDVLSHISKVHFNGAHDHINAEMLYIKSYYLKIAWQYQQPKGVNIRLEEALENKLKALQAYLRRNKTAIKIDLQGHKNFIGCVQKLSKARAIIHDSRTRYATNLKRRAKQLLEAVGKKLKDDIIPIVDREWIFERLEELEKLLRQL